MQDPVERARASFLPRRIRILFVAEAPPPVESNRFFYYRNVRTGDALFLEMMKVLYPCEGTDAKLLRARKSDLLMRFKEDGYYLVDACDCPLPKRLGRSGKKRAVKQDLPSLKAKLKKVCTAETPIVLISRSVYDVCRQELRDFNVINTEMIDFPASGKQPNFRRKLRALLSNFAGTLGCR